MILNFIFNFFYKSYFLFALFSIVYLAICYSSTNIIILFIEYIFLKNVNYATMFYIFWFDDVLDIFKYVTNNIIKSI